VAGDAAWTDYSVTVHLISDDANGAIGVMFRYQDANNYYRFSMDRQRCYRRLVRKAGGFVTILWQDAAPYALGQEYALTLECVGGELTGYVDGVQLFRVRDNRVAGGRIALYCWANTAARFLHVQVDAWRPYYTFGEEGRLSVGARVRVYAGRGSEPVPEERGVAKRFVGANRPLLPTGQVDLRVVAKSGEPAHTRRFVSDFVPVGARVLRSGDGTGLLIVVPAPHPIGSVLQPGEYRLSLTYRRNNRTIDADSDVLSEAGESGAEQATLDIPWQQ
jgi:hypothetical protein